MGLFRQRVGHGEGKGCRAGDGRRGLHRRWGLGPRNNNSISERAKERQTRQEESLGERWSFLLLPTHRRAMGAQCSAEAHRDAAERVYFHFLCLCQTESIWAEMLQSRSLLENEFVSLLSGTHSKNCSAAFSNKINVQCLAHAIEKTSYYYHCSVNL